MPAAVCRRARAQALPLAAMAMIAMVGGLAMVVDTGMFLVIQRQLQSAADAAALAAAWYPNVCPAVADGCHPTGDATLVAQQIAHANADALAAMCQDGVKVPSVQVGARLNRPIDANTVIVSVSCDASYSFGRILPIVPTKHIEVSAAAAIGSYGPNGDIAPFLPACPAPASSPPPPCRIARLID